MKFQRSLFLLSLVTALASCSKPQGDSARTRSDDAIPVTVVPVESVPLDRAISIIGTLFAKDEATIGAQVEGQVEKTRVDFGDRVTTGQELALIDTAAYQAQARQSAANVAKMKASALNAEQNLRRVQDLQKDKISSASDLDKSVADAEQPPTPSPNSISNAPACAPRLTPPWLNASRAPAII
jgi:membrane fusion protein (multidrug efflux system)